MAVGVLSLSGVTLALGDSGDRRGPLRRGARPRWAALAALVAALTAPAGASATAYYVAPGGSDSAAGTSPSAAWGSLGKIGSAASLAPGDQVLLSRGGTWSGSVNLSRSGTAAAPITIGAFGSGAMPVIAGGGCITLSGAYQVVTGLEIRSCTRWGIRLAGNHTTVDGNVVSNNVVGVEVDNASSQNRIIHNQLIDNNRLAANPGSGAFGVLLNGSDNYVAANLIRGSDTASPVYGRDGSAVEVYRGQRNLITRNLAIDNLTFSELGNSESADNTYSYNIVRSSLQAANFIVTRGSGNTYGPVHNTRVFNNTVSFTGSQAEGFICQNCGTDILFLRNNIISAPHKVGYAAGPVDEDYDLFLGGGIRQFTAGPHSFVGDPKWVSVGAADFRLQPGSPAIDRGQDLGPQVDFAGTKVPYGSAPDLGALEYAPVENAPPPPLPRLVAGIAVPRTLRRSRLIALGLVGACSANLPARFRIFVGFSPRDARRLRIPGRRRNGMVVISAKAVNATGGRAQAVRITLSRAAATRLRRAAHIPVTLRLQVEVTTGDGRATRVRRSIRLLAT